MPHDLFISYAREDRERVRRIADELTRRGYDVWWDTSGLRSGDDYRDRIEEALRTARGVVVAWSRASVDSDFVCDEAGRGHRRRVLLPVFIDKGIDPPLGFGGIHTTDLSDWLLDPSDPAPFDQFVGDVQAVLGREPALEPAAAPHPVPRRTAGARKPGALLPVVLGGGALLLATILYQTTRTVQEDARAEIQTSRTGRAGDSTRPPPSPERPGNRLAALGDLSCTIPGSGRNPIQERAERLTGTPFSVDTGTHLLLGRDGAPVSVVPARIAAGPLQSRRVIVAHYTAAPPGTAARFLQNARATGSVHVLIARDGRVTQLVPFDMVAGHAGNSRWKDLESVNAHSIGIDLDNLGLLQRRGGGWALDRNVSVPDDSVDVINGRGWHRYTDAQLRVFLEVSCALRRAYPGIEDVVGHDSISRVGKQDPGPAFPMALIRSRLFPER